MFLLAFTNNENNSCHRWTFVQSNTEKKEWCVEINSRQRHVMSMQILSCEIWLKIRFPLSTFIHSLSLQWAFDVCCGFDYMLINTNVLQLTIESIYDYQMQNIFFTVNDRKPRINKWVAFIQQTIMKILDASAYEFGRLLTKS